MQIACQDSPSRPARVDRTGPQPLLQTGPQPELQPLVATAPKQEDLPQTLLPAVVPKPALQELSCGQDEVLRLAVGGFVTYSLRTLKASPLRPLPGLSAAVTTMGQTTLLFGLDGMYRFYEGQSSATAFARVPLVGPSLLWSDAATSNAFFLHDMREKELRHLVMDATMQGFNLGQRRPLPEFDLGVLAQLRDGSWLYTAQGGLRRLGQSTLNRYALADSELVTQLLPAARLDEFWVLTSSGHARLFQRLGALRLKRQWGLRGLPIAAAQRGIALAVVSVRSRLPAEPAFWLQVFEGDHMRLERRLPTRLAGNAGTEAQLRTQLCLVASRPWVALGGRSGLSIINYLDGSKLL